MNGTQLFTPFYASLISSLVSLAVGYLVGRYKERKKKKEDALKEREDTKKEIYEEIKLLKRGQAILLRELIERYYQQYKDPDVKFPPAEWHDFQKTYDTYKALGGNSTGDKYYSILSKKELQ